MPQDGAMSLLQSILQTFQAAPSAWSCVVSLALIWALTLGGAAWVVGRREYVLEQ